MKFEKSPQELVDLFDSVVPKNTTSVIVRQMFGYPCAFCNGNMFMGLFQDSLFLRLSEPDRETFLKLDKVVVFAPMSGRPMKEYMVVPKAIISNPQELKRWIDKSVEYTQSLPPKIKK